MRVQAGGAGLKQGAVPNGWGPLVVKAGQQCPQITAPIVASQIEQESSWINGQVSGDIPGVQHGGAAGLAQFMPSTWAEYGGGGDPMDPAAAIAAQGRYDCALVQQMQGALASGAVKGDLLTLALASYNAGPDAVLKYGGVPPFSETQQYVIDIPKRAADKYAAPTSVTPPVAGTGTFGARVVAAAERWINTDYSWGGGDFQGPTSGIGTSTVGFDCSGLVLNAVYAASGGALKLPHLADDQARMGTAVSLDALQPGDAVAFSSNGGSTFHHIGIYVGGGQIVNAPQTGDVVRVMPISNWTNRGQYTVARRYG